MNRSLKRRIVRLLNPLDFIVRSINGKQTLPPLHLRWDVGPLRGYEFSAAEFRSYLKILAGLTPGHRMLDVGCGCGQIAQAVAADLDETGRYVGCDINSEAIDWCRRHIACRDARFVFHHIDVRNGLYRPKGNADAAAFRFPEAWGSFDIILFKSVFTHMRKEETENYFSQLRRLLKPKGTCLATFFLLNPEQQQWESGGKNSIAFHRGTDGTASANPSLPEAIMAYEENAVRAMLAKHALAVREPVYHGTWTGDRSCLSHQDILLICRDGGPG